MIKIFRKIRQKLIQENKTSSYIKYAIGEIILVMVGILLALQVNNWNELRSNKSKLESYILEYKSELEYKHKLEDQFFSRERIKVRALIFLLIIIFFILALASYIVMTS